MPTNPLVVRQLRVTVSVTRGNTPQTYVFQPHRMRVRVRNGGAQYGNAYIEVFGVPLASMNQIARLFLQAMTPQNTDTVTIEVYDAEHQTFTPFYQGVITWSSVDASAMPQTKLTIEANAAFALMNQSASPYANAGPVLLKDALAAIATPAGFAIDFASTATNYSMTNQRATGSPMNQINSLMRQFPDLTYFTYLQRLVVRKANGPLDGDPISIAPDTGLQSFPVYSSSGLTFSTLFNAQLRPGIALAFTTAFDFVNNTKWVAAVIEHDLEPNYPGGRWSTSVAANAYGPIGNNQ